MKLIKFAAPVLLALTAYSLLYATIQPSSKQTIIASDSSTCGGFPVSQPCPF